MDAASSPLYGEFSTGDLAYDQRIISTNKTFDGKDNSISLLFEPYDSKPMFIKIPLVSRNYPANTY